jgi:flagellar hook-associated protein 1 FlgK
MTGNLTLSLLTAQSGLLSNQAALDTSANNIANAHTKGYSRKIPNFQPRVLNGSGAGVEFAEVQRIVDEGLLKTLRVELSTLKSLEIKDSYYSRIQDTFGTPADNTSLSHAMAQITAAVEALALSPEKIIEQSELVTRAEEIAVKMQDMSSTIQDLRLQADRDIAELATEANDLIQVLDQLNVSIVQSQVVGQDTTDLQDQRDLSLDRLSQIMDINYFQRSDGGMIVFGGNGTTLVGNIPTTIEHYPVGSVYPGQNFEEGDFTGITVTAANIATDITSGIRGGEMHGLLDMRDNILTDLQSQLDELASQLQTTVNQLHNRGTTFPGLQTMTGTRTFTDSATQTIRFTGSTDTKMVLMDQSGNQTAQGSMQSAAILGGAGPFTVDDIATAMQTWLQANGAATATVAVNAEGALDIQLNSNTLYLGFRDETAVGDGSTLSDATIGFDGNGDGTVNETISGFSNFFGLNDFFIDTQGSNVKESDIVTTTFKTATSSTLTFNDETGVMTGSPLVIAANSSLQNIADAINANVTGVTASIVSEGSGSRLRISHNNSGALTVAQTAGTLLTDVGMGDSTLGLSQAIAVRSDIVNNPALVTRGALQWDANLGVAGEYFMSTGDGSIALAMAERFALSTNFSAAGDLGNVTLNFEEYGASILSRNSNKAATVERQFDHKDTLVSNLQAKSDTVRGVNLDEEMSNLILFERGYSASARVISVIQGMFDALENIIR